MTAEVTPAVVVEVIRQGGTVLVALLGLVGVVGVPTWRRLGKIKRAAEATHREAITAREQVKNDHGTNLRDDVDAVIRTVYDLERQQAATHNAVGAVALEVRKLSEQLEGHGRHRRRRRL